ncbi:sigma-70 family RNA polymerase sigma factor [Asanoa sp. NPDC049573]|uniref:sigma-70 family RNA polymerase sigma factor n=1 Tax=Asanoa sp. NPDC049573 TaxID=3155396 RepID=UPI0034194022
MDVTDLVVAARDGDRHALDELVIRFLPLVYTVVGRALRGDPDIDDVVQDTMLRAVRDLPALRDAGSFRAWLMAITVRQVGTHLHRRRTADQRSTPLGEGADLADEDAAVEDLTMLHMALSDQRRQVARASRWLDPADRMLMSLWWAEHAGHLTRAELADAAGLTAAHAGVRVQRARQQLEVSRSVVAALEARPGCARLGAAASGWDGVPSPLWRKRLSRHVRSCGVCGHATAGLVPTDRLLAATLLPVPAVVTMGMLGKIKATAPAGSGALPGKGLLAKVVGAVGTRPVLALLAGGVVVAGVVAAVPQSPESSPPPATAAPSPSPAGLRLGRVSLEAADEPGRYVAMAADLGVLTRVDAHTSTGTRQRATFDVTLGLAKPGCFTLRTRDGRYVRHMSWRLRVSQPERSPLFRGDATFCPRPGPLPGSIALESANYPGWFVRHRDDEVWVDQVDGRTALGADGSFLVRPALAP